MCLDTATFNVRFVDLTCMLKVVCVRSFRSVVLIALRTRGSFEKVPWCTVALVWTLNDQNTLKIV